MSLSRPRRIFRSSPLQSGKGLAKLVTVAGLAGLGMTSVFLFSSSEAPAPAAPARLAAVAPQSRQTVAADASSVIVLDGATIRVNGQIIHLLGITPPARGTICHAASGTDFDCGTAAANALGGLIRNQTVTCDVIASDGEPARGAGICRTGGGELNRALVISGWARAESGRSPLAHDEIDAKSQHRGLWAAGW